MIYDYKRHLKNWRSAWWRRKAQRASRPIHWSRWLVHPFLKAALQDLPCEGYLLLGPFGLSNSFAVYFIHEGRRLFHFELRASLVNGLVSVIDLNSNTGRYNQNSVGYLNGLHHSTREILPGEDFLQVMQDFDALLPEAERKPVEVGEKVWQ